MNKNMRFLRSDPCQESYSGGPLNGLSVTNGYDQWLRRTNVVLRLGGSSLHSAGYSYGEASRLRAVLSGSASATYSYLANSPLVSQIAFTNNGVQRMVTSRQYDLLNRLENIKSVPAASPAVSFDYTYNPANQRTLRRETDASYWRYEYDSLGQVVSGKKYWSDGTPVAGQQFQYAFDDIGNRLATKAGGDENGANFRTNAYYPNLLNQYTSRTVPGAADVIGVSLATNTITVNSLVPYRKGEYFRKELPVNNTTAALWTNITVAANGQTAVSGNIWVARTPESFYYDLDGNLTNDGRWIYTWDAENRLVSLKPNTGVGPQSKLAFDYDVRGRRIRKQVWDNAAGTGNPTNDSRFVYDGWNLLGTLNSSLALVNGYTWGLDLSGSSQGAGGVGGLLWTYDSLALNGQPSTHLAAFDGNGNVATLVNVADGTESARYEYGPFGEVIRKTGAMANAMPFRFSTKYQDDETDLVYYGFRYYAAARGTWLSRDPIEEEGGECLYGAGANNLVNDYDILGKQHIGNLYYGRVINVLYNGQQAGYLYVSIYARNPFSGRVAPNQRVGAVLRIEQHLDCDCGGCFKWRQHFSQRYDDHFTSLDHTADLWKYLPENVTEMHDILDIDYRNEYTSDWYTPMTGEVPGCGYTFSDQPSQYPAMYYGEPEVTRVAVTFFLELVHVDNCSQTSGGDTVVDMRWGFWYTARGVWLFGNHKPGPPYE